MTIDTALDTKKTSEYLATRIAEMAASMPELADLTPDQVDAVSRAVLADELKAEMKRAVLSARISWEDEKAAFLSDKASAHTRKSYDLSLGMLFDWITRKNLSPLDLSPRFADDYIRDLRAQGKDADSCRLYVSAASSFFTFLERRFDEIRNPFRGTKARPSSTWAMAVIPSEEEIRTIIEAAAGKPLLHSALVVVNETGLRIGGLPSLTIRSDGSFVATTKGKQYIGPEPLSSETIAVIKSDGLDPRRPFNPALWRGRGDSETPAETRLAIALKTQLFRLINGLILDRRIKAAYSWHDFRHAYAERNTGKGLVWLRDHLGQASISVTEKYLRNTFGRDISGIKT